MCHAHLPSRNLKNVNSITVGKMQTMVTTCLLQCHERTPPVKATPSSQSSVTTEAPEMERNVSFAPMVNVRYTISRQNYTQEEENAVWYTPQESQGIMKRCQKEITMMERGQSLRDKKYCSRGLEVHTRLGAVARRQTKCLVREKVLDAQDYYGSWADETIAKVCQGVTASSQLWAQRVALLDHKDAQKYLEMLSSLSPEEMVIVFKNSGTMSTCRTQETAGPMGAKKAKTFVSRQA